MSELILLTTGAVIGVILIWLARRAFTRHGVGQTTIETDTVIERVREVGRLVGLEVAAKEIATSTRGLSWLPPAILSKARLAMIFQFEKQYAIDLQRIGEGDVRQKRSGVWSVTLPPIEGALRLTDVTPYDISSGKALGLFDVIPMDAKAQSELMRTAQEQAARIYADNEPRYTAEARRSIESQLTALLSMLGVEIEFDWSEHNDTPEEQPIETGPAKAKSKRRRKLPFVSAAAKRLRQTN